MLDHAAVLKIAEALLEQETGPHDPELSIDYERARKKAGIFIALSTAPNIWRRATRWTCWPILVDLNSGEARLDTLRDRPLWRES